MVASRWSPGEARSAGEDGTAGGRQGAGAEAEREDLLAWSCCPSPARISACRSWQDLRFWEHAASPRPFSSCVCEGRRWATLLGDEARGSGGKESSGELRHRVGCAMGIIPCSFRAALDFSWQFPPAEAAHAALGSARRRQAALAPLHRSPLVVDFPRFQRKRRWWPGFLGIPRILPESLVPRFSLGWGRWLLWVGGCSCWQEPEGSSFVPLLPCYLH